LIAQQAYRASLTIAEMPPAEESIIHVD